MKSNVFKVTKTDAQEHGCGKVLGKANVKSSKTVARYKISDAGEVVMEKMEKKGDADMFKQDIASAVALLNEADRTLDKSSGRASVMKDPKAKREAEDIIAKAQASIKGVVSLLKSNLAKF